MLTIFIRESWVFFAPIAPHLLAYSKRPTSRSVICASKLDTSSSLSLYLFVYKGLGISFSFRIPLCSPWLPSLDSTYISCPLDSRRFIIACLVTDCLLFSALYLDAAILNYLQLGSESYSVVSVVRLPLFSKLRFVCTRFRLITVVFCILSHNFLYLHRWFLTLVLFHFGRRIKVN